ncbi:uncharacterized protein [Macaca nemestrina]|uniref:uncharacterized protein n=1 Tax=Macaca nemestrina TaxID=9545 RepID=UPI0039B84A9D
MLMWAWSKRPLMMTTAWWTVTPGRLLPWPLQVQVSGCCGGDGGLVGLHSLTASTPAPSPQGPSTGLAARHRPLPRKRRKRKAATGEAEPDSLTGPMCYQHLLLRKETTTTPAALLPLPCLVHKTGVKGMKQKKKRRLESDGRSDSGSWRKRQHRVESTIEVHESVWSPHFLLGLMAAIAVAVVTVAGAPGWTIGLWGQALRRMLDHSQNAQWFSFLTIAGPGPSCFNR